MAVLSSKSTLMKKVTKWTLKENYTYIHVKVKGLRTESEMSFDIKLNKSISEFQNLFNWSLFIDWDEIDYLLWAVNWTVHAYY